VKDVLSHATSWEELALPDLIRLARGDMPALAIIGDLESANYDGPNSILMALRKNLPLDQVLREMDIVHADFVEAARGSLRPILSKASSAVDSWRSPLNTTRNTLATSLHGAIGRGHEPSAPRRRTLRLPGVRLALSAATA
jgi:hypothetical protein